MAARHRVPHLVDAYPVRLLEVGAELIRVAAPDAGEEDQFFASMALTAVITSIRKFENLVTVVTPALFASSALMRW